MTILDQSRRYKAISFIIIFLFNMELVALLFLQEIIKENILFVEYIHIKFVWLLIMDSEWVFILLNQWYRSWKNIRRNYLILLMIRFNIEKISLRSICWLKIYWDSLSKNVRLRIVIQNILKQIHKYHFLMTFSH